MEALEEEPAPANGEGAVDSGGAGSTASPAPDGQERLLFVASVLIGCKVEVQVRRP